MDPVAAASPERKEELAKLEGMLDGIYKDGNVNAADYTEFMKAYNQDFEEAVKTNPGYKFEYKKSAAPSAESAPIVIAATAPESKEGETTKTQ